MKFGLIIPLWLMVLPLFSQNCEKVEIPPVRYFEETDQGSQEVDSYLVPCSDSRTLSYMLPSVAWVGYIDPDPSTSAGVILVVMKREPGKKVLSISEFQNLIYRDVNGSPLAFTDPNEPIPMSQLQNLGNVSNEYVLIPVIVSNINGHNSTTWFEEDCVRVFAEYELTLINQPAKEYEFIHFDEINFIHWPVDTSIIDFFEFTFTDQATGQDIPYTMTGNSSFRLQFPAAKGIFNYKMTWKDKDCQAVEIGVNWSFPVIRLQGDTVAGYQNIEKCIPVRAFNFESVTSFEIQAIWDRDSISYSDIKNIHPALEPYLKMGDATTTGNNQVIQLVWLDAPDTLTLPDSAVLFEWCGRPLADAGKSVGIGFTTSSSGPGTTFSIYGLEAETRTRPGGIYVQEDRELNYDLNQLCNTLDGKRRIELDIVNDEAYPYTFSINTPLVRDSTVDSLPYIIPDVPPGNYEFTIRDSFGFEKTETFIVRENIPPNFQMEIDQERITRPTCLNPFGGQIAVSVSPDNQSYKLDLLNDAADFVKDSVSGLVAGRYIIQAVDSDGCFDTISYTLRNPREIKISWDDSRLVLCPGKAEVVLYIEDQYTTPDSTLEYQLDGGQLHRPGDSIVLTKPGKYQLELWNGDGCTLDTSIDVRAGPPQLNVWDTTALELYLGDTLEFTAPDPDGLTGLQWDYNGSQVGNQTTIQYTPGESGIFHFQASVYDQCMYTDTLMVRVITPDQGTPEFAFPNVFTPNGDGVNDVFKIIPTREIQKVVSFQVYDRYGNHLYRSDIKNDDINVNGWNGRTAGVDVPPGIYAVQVELKLLNGRAETVGFDVLLLR